MAPYIWHQVISNLTPLAGGRGDDTRITVWDSCSSKGPSLSSHAYWTSLFSAAVGYQNYLIVACGSRYDYKDVVEVLDSSSGRWYSAQPVPVGGHFMSSVVV